MMQHVLQQALPHLAAWPQTIAMQSGSGHSCDITGRVANSGWRVRTKMICVGPTSTAYQKGVVEPDDR